VVEAKETPSEGALAIPERKEVPKAKETEAKRLKQRIMKSLVIFKNLE